MIKCPQRMSRVAFDRDRQDSRSGPDTGDDNSRPRNLGMRFVGCEAKEKEGYRAF